MNFSEEINHQDAQPQKGSDYPASIVQSKTYPGLTPLIQPIVQTKRPGSSLPGSLQQGIEQLSGIDMNDVNVHYNSEQPAQLQAHAFAQGTDIHLAPGQEEHLPHEAWHVVQQKQGRVQSTTQLKGTGINDDAGLEQEADEMGNKASSIQLKKEHTTTTGTNDSSIVQRVLNASDTLLGHDQMYLSDGAGRLVNPLNMHIYNLVNGIPQDSGTEYKPVEGDFQVLRHWATDFINTKGATLNSNHKINNRNGLENLTFTSYMAGEEDEDDEDEELADKEIQYYDDQNEDQKPFPVVNRSNPGATAGTHGVRTCVALLVRATSATGNIYLGSIHIDDTGMESLERVNTSMQLLRTEVETKMQENGDALATHEAYAVGGQKTNDEQDYLNCARILYAALDMKLINNDDPVLNLQGARLLVNATEETEDAVISVSTAIDHEGNVMFQNESGSEDEEDNYSSDEDHDDEEMNYDFSSEDEESSKRKSSFEDPGGAKRIKK